MHEEFPLGAIFWIPFLAFLVLSLWLLQSGRRRERARQARLRAFGLQHGLAFRERDDNIRQIHPFRLLDNPLGLFYARISGEFVNVLQGDVAGVTITVADWLVYSNVKGAVIYHTVCIAEHEGSFLPHLVLTPRSDIFEWLSTTLGKDTPVPDDVDMAFLRAFQVAGHEADVRRIFTPKLRGFLMDRLRYVTALEMHGDTLFVNSGKRLETAFIPAFVRSVTGLMDMLRLRL